MQDSVYTKIIKGEMPCHKVYEDDYAFAFLDIHPIQPGHVLVVPKKQVDFVWNLDHDDYVALMEAVQKVGRRLLEVFPEKERVGVMIEGLEMSTHAHVKVFPFSDENEYRSVPDPDVEPDHKQLAQIAEKLYFEST